MLPAFRRSEDGVEQAFPTHAIVICDRCRSTASGELRGAPALLERLDPHSWARGFRLETVPCLAGCDRPVAVAFVAPFKATYLFGDIDPENDAQALLEFARQYRSMEDGWSKESERPPGLRGKTLARIPAIRGLGDA
jgi:predicted metal-binding protein